MSPASQICLVVESPASFDRVTCLPPKNASAPWGGVGSRQLTIIVWQVSYVQYLLACQNSQRSTPYNIVKSGLPWKRVFRRRHLGRRVTAVTCLRWPTVSMQQSERASQLHLCCCTICPLHHKMHQKAKNKKLVLKTTTLFMLVHTYKKIEFRSELHSDDNCYQQKYNTLVTSLDLQASSWIDMSFCVASRC